MNISKLLYSTPLLKVPFLVSNHFADKKAKSSLFKTDNLSQNQNINQHLSFLWQGEQYLHIASLVQENDNLLSPYQKRHVFNTLIKNLFNPEFFYEFPDDAYADNKPLGLFMIMASSPKIKAEFTEFFTHNHYRIYKERVNQKRHSSSYPLNEANYSYSFLVHDFFNNCPKHLKSDLHGKTIFLAQQSDDIMNSVVWNNPIAIKNDKPRLNLINSSGFGLRVSMEIMLTTMNNIAIQNNLIDSNNIIAVPLLVSVLYCINARNKNPVFSLSKRQISSLIKSGEMFSKIEYSNSYDYFRQNDFFKDMLSTFGSHNAKNLQSPIEPFSLEKSLQTLKEEKIDLNTKQSFSTKNFILSLSQELETNDKIITESFMRQMEEVEKISNLSEEQKNLIQKMYSQLLVTLENYQSVKSISNHKSSSEVQDNFRTNILQMQSIVKQLFDDNINQSLNEFLTSTKVANRR